MEADDIFPMLTAFFEAVEQKITSKGGVLLSYNGDAVVAAFNLPLQLDDYRDNALEAARSVALLAEEERFSGELISVRIGVATGPLTAGLVGGTARASYTAYGDAVNLAARLEALNKETGTTILADGATLDGQSPCQGRACLGEREIRGFSKPVEVWDIVPQPALEAPPAAADPAAINKDRAPPPALQ